MSKKKKKRIHVSKERKREFPGDPVFKNLLSSAEDLGFLFVCLFVSGKLYLFIYF